MGDGDSHGFYVIFEGMEDGVEDGLMAIHWEYKKIPSKIQRVVIMFMFLIVLMASGKIPWFINLHWE